MSVPTSAETTIRLARPDDYGSVCRLMDALDALHHERLSWMFKTPDEQPRSEDYFAELLKSEDSTAFVADAGHVVGVAVGLMQTAPSFPVFIQQRWGVLDGLVVDPAWRRRGIGERLARSVEAWALRAGAPWVEVKVYQINPGARQFYETLGYLPLSTKLRKVYSDAS